MATNSCFIKANRLIILLQDACCVAGTDREIASFWGRIAPAAPSPRTFVQKLTFFPLSTQAVGNGKIAFQKRCLQSEQLSEFAHQVKVLSAGHLPRFSISRVSGSGRHGLNLFTPQVLPQFGPEVAAGLQHRIIEPFKRYGMIFLPRFGFGESDVLVDLGIGKVPVSVEEL